MRNRRSRSEIAAWAGVSIIGGLLVAWIDASASDVQGPVTVLLLVTFALTLPGRAPIPLVAVCSSIGLPLVHLVVRHDASPMFALLLIPAFIGAAGGRFAGRLLDTAASTLVELPRDEGNPWYRRALSTRALLAVALTTIAIAGWPMVAMALHGAGHPLSSWLATVWQIMTLLGWIGATPIILAERPFWHAARAAAGGPRAIDLLSHLAIVWVLASVHAVLVEAVTAALFIPIVPGWRVLDQTAFVTYLPLDMLAYLAILTLGFASDAERRRRAASDREALLRTESLASRLGALRARLNPHFLFNALNGVQTLTRAGKTEDATHMLDGVSSLLRYVLDERPGQVPLHDELQFAEQYLQVQQVRFGAKLRFTIDADATVRTTPVPQLLLQPIVENAVEHGVARTLDGGVVRITAKRLDDELELVIENDGPAVGETEESAGIGLANTRERLDRLYDGRARFAFRAPEGAVVRVSRYRFPSAPLPRHDRSSGWIPRRDRG